MSESIREKITYVKLGQCIDFGTCITNDNVVNEILKCIKTARHVVFLPAVSENKMAVVSYYIDEDIEFVYNSYKYKYGSLLLTRTEIED
jgi:hypothetical protein